MRGTAMSNDDVRMLKGIYQSFNARDIDGVLAVLSDDIAWANGMDGGHVHGREAVRAYWTRQWAIVSPQVEPVGFEVREEGLVAVEVIQSIFDLNGQPLGEQTHGLKDKTVTHIFRVEGGTIVRFDIQDAQ
jgi:ketosteroid isomerase-like protein